MDNKLDTRYQLIMTGTNSNPEFYVYEVVYDTTTNKPLYLADPDPIELFSTSVDGIMGLLNSVYNSIRLHGVITDIDISQSGECPLLDIDYDNNPVYEDIDVNEEDYVVDVEYEDYIQSILEEQYDEDNKVLDLIDYMERNK